MHGIDPRNIILFLQIIALAMACLILSMMTSCHPARHDDPANTATAFPYLDTSLSFDQRVNDLVGRMTLEEKIGQMMNAAPAIQRLGIPEYNWWNECLHGVARSGLATVFPQAIGMGASWDEDMLFRVSSTISDEARAKYQEYIRKNKRLIYQGLTFWSPNINIFRDPRWGRGQETYGEDPTRRRTKGISGRPIFPKALESSDPKIIRSVIDQNEIHLYESADHHGNWLECIRSRKTPITTAEIAHRACSACLIHHIVMKLKRKVYWDPVKEHFKNDEEANARLSRPQRSPYIVNA